MTMVPIMHDDVIKWKNFPRHGSFVGGIHRSPVNSPHKGQWRGGLIFSSICAWINGWVNNREAGDLRRHRAYYDVTVIDTSMTMAANMHLRTPVLRPLVFPGRDPDTKTLDEMIAESPGQLNFTHFLNLFGEKMHGKGRVLLPQVSGMKPISVHCRSLQSVDSYPVCTCLTLPNLHSSMHLPFPMCEDPDARNEPPFKVLKRTLLHPHALCCMYQVLYYLHAVSFVLYHSHHTHEAQDIPLHDTLSSTVWVHCRA